MTTSERELRIRRNRIELLTDPNRTLIPSRVPTRTLVFNVRAGQKKTQSFNVLGDSFTPHTALHYFAQNGRKGKIAAVWDEK